MKFRIRLAAVFFVTNLMGTAFLTATAQEPLQEKCYNHAEYMEYLHKVSDEKFNPIESDKPCDMQITAYSRLRPLSRAFLDDVLVQVQWLINEKKYKNACDVLEFLVNELRLHKLLFLDGSVKFAWNDEEMERIHVIFREILPLAYENYTSFDFDAYSTFLRQSILAGSTIDHEVFKNALTYCEDFVQRGFYREVARIFLIVWGSFRSADINMSISDYERWYQVFKKLVPHMHCYDFENYCDNDFTWLNYVEKTLLDKLILGGTSTERVCGLAQEIVEEALVTRSEYFGKGLSVLADYSKEQNCIDKVIDYCKDIFRRLLVQPPLLLENFKPLATHDFGGGMFLQVQRISDVLDVLLNLTETKSGAEAKVVLGKEVLNDFVSKACADMHFVLNNQSLFAAKILLWARGQIRDYFKFQEPSDWILGSEEAFEDFIKKQHESLVYGKNFIFDRTFLLHETEKKLIAETIVTFALRLTIFMQTLEDYQGARELVQKVYKRLQNERFLVAAEVLKKYVEVCPQTYKAGDEFEKDYGFSFYCYGNGKAYYLKPDKFEF